MDPALRQAKGIKQWRRRVRVTYEDGAVQTVDQRELALAHRVGRQVMEACALLASDGHPPIRWEVYLGRIIERAVRRPMKPGDAITDNWSPESLSEWVERNRLDEQSRRHLGLRTRR